MPTVIVQNKDGEFLERHEITGSLRQWVIAECQYNDVDWEDTPRPPYSAELNGAFYPYDDHDRILNDDDLVTVTIEPQWPAVPYIIALIAAAYSYYVASNIDTGYQDTAESGQSIYTANVNANRVKPSGVIRELAGEQHIYPDLICPVRRKYIDNEEYAYLNLSVTRGFADVQDNNLYIDQTPVSYYAGDIDYQIKDPGEDISGHEAHENWYQTREVSDLELKTSKGIIAGNWTIDTSGATMTSYLNGTVTAFPFQVGEDFEITGGSNPGIYLVDSISGGSNETATLIGRTRTGGDTGRIETLTQQVYEGIGRTRRRITRTIFSSTGSPSLAATTGETVEKWESLNGGINWEGPFLLIPQNETTRYMEVDVRFPGGLVELNNNNEETDKFVRVVVRWRNYGNAGWTNVVVDTTDATFDEVAKTVLVDFGSEITPEFMVRRVTKDSETISVTDIVQIKRVKCLLESPTSYSDVTTIQMRLRGTNALAKTAQNKVNVKRASRKLPTLQEIQDAANGTPFDLGAAAQQDATWNLLYAVYRTNYEIQYQFYEEFVGGYSSFDISPNGLYLITLDSTLVDVKIRFFALNSAYDLINPEFIGSIYIDDDIDAFNVRYLLGGAKVAVTYRDPAIEIPPAPIAPYVRIYNLSTPNDPSTASTGVNDVFDLTTVDNNKLSLEGLEVNTTGLQYWVGIEDSIKELEMSSGFDLSTSSFTGNELDVSADITPAVMVSFRVLDSYSKVYVLASDDRIYAYTLSTPGDITTATIDNVDGFASYSGVDLLVGPTRVLTASATSLSFWDIPSTINSRRSRSMVRFAANAIYDAIGSDILDQVDFTAMNNLDVTLEAREDYLDAEFADETTLWEAIKIMASVGYSEPVIKEGIFQLVRTVAGANFTQLYTPDVMLDEGVQIDMTFDDDQEPDGVDVEYFSLDTYSNEVYEYRLPGDLGLRPKRIQAIGIGTEEKAFRMAARERRRLKAKPSTYTFTTEMDALNSNYGDPIAIASDVFGGQYGHVTAVDGSVITLDFEPDSVGSAVATFRTPEGDKSSTHTITFGPAANQITLTSPAAPSFTLITDENQQPNLVTIGTESTYVKRAIVRKIVPSDENTVQVTAEEYVASIYDDDDNTPS